MPVEPSDFVQKAIQARHPKDLLAQVSSLMQETILANFHRAPYLLAKEEVWNPPGRKTRVIDDCSVCGLNQTVGLREKFVLQSIDQMCAMLCWSLKNASEGNHPSVVGRTFDLKSAYKQFGLCERDRILLRIAVTDPTRSRPVLLGLNSLPFVPPRSTLVRKCPVTGWTWPCDTENIRFMRSKSCRCSFLFMFGEDSSLTHK